MVLRQQGVAMLFPIRVLLGCINQNINDVILSYLMREESISRSMPSK